jgi:hypothetical protein
LRTVLLRCVDAVTSPSTIEIDGLALDDLDLVAEPLRAAGRRFRENAGVGAVGDRDPTERTRVEGPCGIAIQHDGLDARPRAARTDRAAARDRVDELHAERSRADEDDGIVVGARVRPTPCAVGGLGDGRRERALGDQLETLDVDARLLEQDGPLLFAAERQRRRERSKERDAHALLRRAHQGAASSSIEITNASAERVIGAHPARRPLPDRHGAWVLGDRAERGARCRGKWPCCQSMSAQH